MTEKHLMNIPKEVSATSDALKNAGFEAYLVGGCVRDLLRGEKPKDWDITTDAKPEEIIKLFDHTYYENEFGTVGVVHDEAEDASVKSVEVTTYRLESRYSDHRHPDNVTFSDSLEDDLKRRDFTMNALALGVPKGTRSIQELSMSLSDTKDSHKGHLVDLFGGVKDIHDKTVRAVGNPRERFEEDALRMLRAVRFAAELDFNVSRETSDAIQKLAPTLEKMAQERIKEEFVRIIMSKKPKRGVALAHELGLLRYILPELEHGIDVEQNQAHSYSVFEHSVRTLQAAADKGWELEIRLAALFHDMAKPKTRAWDEKKQDWSFHGHEVVGAHMAKKALQRLRFPKETVDTVFKLVRWHMFFSDPDKITLSAVRRLIRNVGEENVDDILKLRRADRIGTGRPKEKPYRLRKYEAMIDEVRHDPVSVGMLKIDGGTIMDVSRETPGPRIGWILHALLEEVLDDPSKNMPEYLAKRTKELSELKDAELKKLGESGAEKKEEKQEKEVQKIRKKHGVK